MTLMLHSPCEVGGKLMSQQMRPIIPHCQGRAMRDWGGRGRGGLQVRGQSALERVCWVLNDQSEMRRNYSGVSVSIICSNRKFRVQTECSLDSKILLNQRRKTSVNTSRIHFVVRAFSESIF